MPVFDLIWISDKQHSVLLQEFGSSIVVLSVKSNYIYVHDCDTSFNIAVLLHNGHFSMCVLWIALLSFGL